MESPKMEVLENVVTMLRKRKCGICLKRLPKMYKRMHDQDLSLSSLGFDSIESLVASLENDLVVVGKVVFHKDNMDTEGQDGFGDEAQAVGSAKAKKDSKKTKTAKDNLVAMMKEYPEGILMKKLAEVYSQIYRKNLALGVLGFPTVPSLVATLNEDLIVEGEMVFHKIHRPQHQRGAGVSTRPATDSRPATPQTTESPAGKMSAIPPGSLPSTATQLDGEQLYQRVIEVLRKYNLTGASIDQLSVGYFHHFGEELPLKQYMSLYDTVEATKPKTLPTQHSTVPLTAELPQQPAADRSSLPGCSTPPVAAAAAGGSRSSSREAARAERSAPVFRDPYHAQLREFHGDNMRAMEAMENPESTGRRRNRFLDQDTIDNLVEDVIREIAAQGELVTKEKVISKVSQLMQMSSAEAARISPYNSQPLKDLLYCTREINMFIESTDAVMSVCTLYELGQSLAGLKDKKRYEELNMGPLCKLPLIHRLFKIDSSTQDDDIPQIETTDILKQLRTFRRRQSKPKVDLAEFMQYLADHYNCESPYELGIRIKGVALPISTLMKVSRCEHTLLEKAREAVQRELEEETTERLRKIKRNLLEVLPAAAPSSSSAHGSFDLRKKYATMPAAEVALAVFTNAEGVFNPRMVKHVQSFLAHVHGDRLATSLFQLAICGGSLAVPQDLVPKDKTSKTSEKTAQDKPAESLPSEAKVKQHLKENLSTLNSAITLAHLASIERKLNKHFQVKDFMSLAKGSFLDFLVKNIQLLQDTLGSTLILGGDSTELAGVGFRTTKQDVFEFIKQCGDITVTDADDLAHIELALRSHYRIQDSRKLGHGPLQSLAKLVQYQKHLGGGGMSPVYFESALFAKTGMLSAESGCETVGRLGEMSKEQALASLLSCPLLEDLSEWSQWELVFKPLHGSLKDFIERNAANTGLAALEVTPGLLLRLTTQTGDKQFSHAAMTLDPVGAAGHLVSMVVADGIMNTPTALLANHMQSSLAAAVAKQDLSQAEEDMSCYSTVANFLLACLTRIPTRICQALLQQVFLEPLSRVLGQAKSKQVLVTVAQSDPRHINCLHRLGILLGITEWVKDYQKKLTPPTMQNDNLPTTLVNKRKSNLIDSQSSSLSALNMSEDEYAEDNMMDSSFASSNLNHSLQRVNGELDGEAEEEEDDEELFELASMSNGDMSDCNSESKDGHGEQRSEPSDSNEEECPNSDATLDLHRGVIEDIRKNEFGVGVELTTEGQRLMEVHQQRLGRSLDRLSTELYSKDTHFVLELIQNADDNSYPSGDGAVPALAFVVERDCITVLNNEIGFQENNIKAICDVGRSTKGKHKYGYIGQKGIGFKSVFKVTDCPEIHSNGFHLRFDKTCGPMGYILPHWTDVERPLDMQLNGVCQHSWTTKICLPLRRESHQTRNLFYDVHPSLLLFLHRLRSITIVNQSEKRLVKMTRKDLSHNVLEVEHTDGVERWLVVKSTLEPKSIKEEVESTELALAFQLATDVTETGIVCQPQKQPVFAFLPLRSFGFRFIVQGDFDIPSSREDVDRDSSWNQWLRSEIPQLFLKAMRVFEDHPEFQGLQGLCQFLQFIPLPDEVLDFFKPVASQIIQLLKGKPFLPTLSSDGKVVYKQPSQVAVCQDAVIRSVIGGDELERHLSLSYLHPGLSPAPPTSLLSHLGVRQLRGPDVTTVTTAMAKELVRVEGIHSDLGLRKLARLFVCNFRALEHGYGEGDSILQTLRGLPIIPLADGRVVSLSSEGVFFPMEEDRTTKKKTQTGPLSALYKDVSVVHPSLLSCVEPLESQQVRELLRRLGVHELEPQELLEQHIYPSIRSNKWKGKPEAVVVSYLVFIKQHSSTSHEYSDTAVPVLTNKGLLCPGQDRVHFSEEYGNINLTKKLPGYDWALLSPYYVETDDDVAGWRELFSQLGVRDGLIIRKERRTFATEELASSPWSVESTLWQRNTREDIVLDDYPCEEFHALATAQLSAPLLLEQRMALLDLLANNWDTGHHYSQYLTAQVIDSDGRPTKSTKSSFHHFLCRLEWVPAYRPLQGDNQERKYLCPNSVYLTSPEIMSLLGTHVYYVEINPSEFTRALGMRHSISAEVLITYLKEWCIGPAAKSDEQELSEDEGADFTSTVEHIHNVYSYLHKNCSQGTLKELFQHNPAVFVQQEYSRQGDGWCSGRFHHLRDVCWNDPTTMFQRYKQLTGQPDSPIQHPKFLAPFYSSLDGMRDFFTRLLNVEANPNMKQYVGLLELVCSSCSIPTAEVLQDVSVLYARLAHKCKIEVSGDPEETPRLNSSYCSTLKGMVADKRVFPTKDNSWVSLARRPLIADNKELEKIFKPHKQVCLLYLPPAEKKAATWNKTRNLGEKANTNTVPAFNERDRSTFMEICGIRQLSHCVKMEPQTENLRPCPAMQAMVGLLIPHVQKFLYHHEELAELYSDLISDNIGEKIKRLNFAQVGKLYIRYQLDVPDDEEAVLEMEDVICLLKDKKELYIQKDHLSAKLDICRELVKLFCTETSHRKELMHFLSGLITSLNDLASLRRFLNKEDIRELPDDEELWEVPEPITPESYMDRVFSRSYSSSSSAAEPPQPAQDDGEPTLMCWPPKASIHNMGGIHKAGQADGSVVDAVMKKWPPPPGPKDRDPERDVAPRGSSYASPLVPGGGGSSSSSISGSDGGQLLRSISRPAEQPDLHRAASQQSQAGQQSQAAAGVSGGFPPSPEHQRGRTEGADESPETPAPTHTPPCSDPPASSSPEAPQAQKTAVPDAVVLSSTFQGSAGAADLQRPPLNLDFPLWNQVRPPQATLEDMELTCQRPTTVVLSDDTLDVTEIGEWGEQLVNSFLCHWRDGIDPRRPAAVLWCNQSGESGQPFDFKLTFGAGEEAATVYVEVKSTIKKERSFIHLSANELHFALRERERYHLFRVYSAGDAQNVRLCRIQNLAQHLHNKSVELYMFV